MEFLQMITVPNILLLILMALGIWVLISAQRSSLFNAVDMLLDENGKASSSRLALFAALSVSSFVLVYATINRSVGDTTMFYMFCAYVLTWAGSKSLEKAIDLWLNRGSPAGSGYQDYPQRRDPYPNQPPRQYDPYGYPYRSSQPARPHPVFTPLDIPAKEDLAER